MRGVHWNLLVGAVLIGAAIWFAADPGYLGSDNSVSGESPPTSAEPQVVLLPEPLSPVGDSELEGLEFRWLWKGRETLWDLVLLDAAMEELVVVHGIRGTSLSPRGDLLEHLSPGGRFHWFVSYTADQGTFHSIPVPLILPRD